MLHKLNKEPNIISSNNLQYILLEYWSEEISQKLDGIDAIIINQQNQWLIDNTIEAIRDHSNLKISLLPIFINDAYIGNEIINSDGTYKDIISDQLVIKIKHKLSKITSTFNEKNATYDIDTYRVLLHAWSRNKSVKPKKSKKETLGYVYPYFKVKKVKSILKQLQILNNLSSVGLLEQILQDKVQLCANCNDSFLIYKETCPHCHSIAIKSEDVIHHFSCAHIGKESTFKHENREYLNCPKCDKDLRHIGIDYDKPSSVFNCLDCNKNFQNASIIAECHSCDHKNTLDSLHEFPIYKYNLTEKGERKLLNKDKNKEIKETNITIPFETIVTMERNRNLNSIYHTKLIKLYSSKLFSKVLGHKFKKTLWKEIEQVIQEYTISKNHTHTGEACVYFLLGPKKTLSVEERCKTIIVQINKLIEHNLKTTAKIHIDTYNIEEYNGTFT